MDTRILPLAARPDLVPLVAGWVWEAFWREDVHTLDDALAWAAEAASGGVMPQCFVLLRDGTPVGTASLVAHDLDARPDLTPWLASVYVVPGARGHGLALALVRTVEDAARAAGFGTLWLYTRRAERVYLRAGWRTVGCFTHHAERAALMRRDLAGD